MISGLGFFLVVMTDSSAAREHPINAKRHRRRANLERIGRQLIVSSTGFAMLSHPECPLLGASSHSSGSTRSSGSRATTET
jgi:hypothetical protein